MTDKSNQRNNAPEVKVTNARLTRRQQLTKLLKRKSGALIAQIRKAFDWQPHSALAALSALRKCGVAVERTDTDKGPVCRITGGV